MTTNQLFFALISTFTVIGGLFLGILVKYIDAKIDKVDSKIGSLEARIDIKFEFIDNKLDSIAKQVNLLVQYMISHEGRISILEERTKNR